MKITPSRFVGQISSQKDAVSDEKNILDPCEGYSMGKDTRWFSGSTKGPKATSCGVVQGSAQEYNCYPDLVGVLPQVAGRYY